MANEALTVTLSGGDRRQVQAAIDRVVQGVQTMDGFFDAVEMHMIDSITKNFESGGRPLPWAPLSERTIELKGSSGILEDSGKLKQSVNSSNTERGQLSLTLWAGEAHGLFHQLADMDPLEQWGVVNQRGMPFRPFLLFQEEDLTEIDRILERWADDIMR